MFKKIAYRHLNARQKEAFNFQKISAVLADYGFVTMRLSNDWCGADFIAQHIDGHFLKVQLKGRLTFEKKYCGQELYICFPNRREWFLYPHDELMHKVLAETKISGTLSWKKAGEYSFPQITKKLRPLLERYRLRAEEARGLTSG